MVCGLLEVIASFSPTSAFSNVDLPELGRPTIDTRPDRNATTLILADGGASSGRPARVYAAGVEIRQADRQDWPAIWPIFAAVVAAGDSYAFPDPMDSADARALWMEGPPARTVVAVENGEVLGTAKMGPNRPGRGAHVATASFMVDPGRQRRGVGRRLGEHVLQWAAATGYRSMQFNAVVETNTAAVALWRSLGFEVVGTVPEAFDHARDGLVGLHVMYRRLEPPGRPEPDSV